jgi:hypothetical protein
VPGTASRTNQARAYSKAAERPDQGRRHRTPVVRISQLTALVKTRLRRMQYRPGLLDGFLAKTASTSVTSTIEDR